MRILLADSQPKVRFALRVLLERRPGIDVIGEAADAEQLLRQTQETRPDLVLVAWGLPGIEAPDLLQALRGACSHVAVIVLSGRPEVRLAALTAGADDFVSKMDSPDCLLSAIHSCYG